MSIGVPCFVSRLKNRSERGTTVVRHGYVLTTKLFCLPAVGAAAADMIRRNVHLKGMKHAKICLVVFTHFIHPRLSCWVGPDPSLLLLWKKLSRHATIYGNSFDRRPRPPSSVVSCAPRCRTEEVDSSGGGGRPTIIHPQVTTSNFSYYLSADLFTIPFTLFSVSAFVIVTTTTARL